MGHANVDCRSTLRLRFNTNRPIDQPNALAHAGETQTVSSQGCFRLESFTFIANNQVNLTGVFLEFHRRLFNPAVLDHVVDRFLQNAEQGKTDLLWYSIAHIAAELDF